MMYMILQMTHSNSGFSSGYMPIFTDDMYRVSVALETKGTKVYKLDGLTEVTRIDITYQEITKETAA